MATVKLHIFSNLYTAILITFSINLLACKHPLHSCILGAAAASCIQKNHCRLLSFLLVRLGVILQISLSPGLSVLLKGIISSFLQTFCLFVCFFSLSLGSTTPFSFFPPWLNALTETRPS